MASWKRFLLASLAVLATLVIRIGEAGANTLVGGAITSNTTWTTANSPYEVTSDVIVYNTARLTIQPGVTVKFHTSTSLIIGYYVYDFCGFNGNCQERGALTVSGTAAQPVLFTSFSGQNGDWKGLSFGNATDYSGLTSSMSYLTVEKAGQGQTLNGTVGSTGANIMLFYTGTGFTWDHVEANKGTGFGWYFYSSTLNAGTSLAGRQNGNYNLYMYASSGTSTSMTLTQSSAGGAYIDNSSPVFNGASITLNPEGLHARNSANPTVSGSTIDSNTNYSVYTEDLNSRVTITGTTVSNNGKGADGVAGTGDDSYTMRVSTFSTINTNSFSGNGKQGIEMVGGNMTANGRWFLPGTGTFQPYVVLNETMIYNVARLTVDAGVTVQFASGAGLIIGYYVYDHCGFNGNCQERGALSVNGTAAQPVLFTSQSGATNGWKGVSFGNATDYSGLTSTMTYVTVEKAGQGQTLNGTVGTTNADIMLFYTGVGFTWDHVQTNLATGFGLYVFSTGLTATAATATGNTNSGVYANGSTLNLSGSTVSSNTASGILLASSNGTYSGNTISNNSGYGIDTSGSAPSITGNTISNSGNYAIRYIIGNSPSISGNTLTGNTKPGIECVGGTLTTNHTWATQAGEPFITVTGSEIVVYNTSRLTVAGGNTVKFSSGTGLVVGFYVYDMCGFNGNCQERGSLTVNGTAGAPVLFTSTSGAAGGWKGVSFGNATDYSGLTSSASYLTVEKAGQGQTLNGTIGTTNADIMMFYTGTGFGWDHVEANNSSGFGWYAYSSTINAGTSLAGRQNGNYNLYMYASSGTMTSMTLTQSSAGGAYVDNSSPVFNSPSVTLNPEGLHFRNSSTPTVSGGTIDSNTNYSVYTEDLASRVTITGSTVSNNGKGADTIAGTGDDSYTMRVSTNSTINTNSFSGNGKQGIEMVGGNMTANGRWFLPGSGTFQPYVLLNETMIYNTARLTVDAGVTVQFASGTGLIIGYYVYDMCGFNGNCQERGALSVNGTAAQPVLFTSQSGATNGWKGVSFGNATDYSGLTSTMTYVTVEKAGQGQTLNGTVGTTNADVMLFYTGTSFPWDHVQTNLATGFGLYVYSSGLTATAATSTGNTNNGIYANGSTLNLSGSTVSSNTASGIFLTGSNGTYSGNTLNANTGYGIDTSGSSPNITGNTISNSGNYAIRYVVGNSPSITSNTLTGNTKPGIECVGGLLTTNHTWATQSGEPFFTVTGSEVVVYNTSTLTVGAGNTIKFSSGTGLVIGYYVYDMCGFNGNCQERGSLQVQGNSSSPVLFTAASGSPGTWKGVAFGNATDYSGLTSTLNYVIIEKAGQAQTLNGSIGSTSANLMLFYTGTSFAINNLDVTQGSGAGIYSYQSVPNVRNSVVAYNTGSGLVGLSGGAPSFTFGDVFGNGANSGWSAGANSKAVDPQFTNYVGGDYHLNPGSPCIDAGTTSTGLAYLGAAPDMGAVEYGAAINCANPATLNGTPCNDGNACTQTDVCQNQQCVGSNPIVCSASDQCHAAGTCNPGNGACSNPSKANGTACSDGSLCTQTDTCQAGVCTGGNAVVCTALDQCHSVGACQAVSGVCTNPVIGTGVFATYYRDQDTDGYGNAGVTTQACSQPAGFVANGSDCNDASASIHPGAAEACNNVDDDCDGSIDENLTTTYYADADGDGFGNAGAALAACAQPAGYVANAADCNDASAAIHPGAVEICNGGDDNCNGVADEGNPGSGVACSTGLQGVCAAGTTTCISGAIACAQSKSPSPEACDGLDNDCDGQTDEGVKTTYFADADADGYGSPAGTVQACSPPAGYVGNSSDCNDASAAVHPGAIETCNNVDDDCDGQTDEGTTTTFYADADADGYGNPAATAQACSLPAGYVTNASDCNDASAAVHPGAAESCNGADDDCDGQTDEGNPGGGVACGTGNPGVCAAGTTACTAGALACNQSVQPSAEACDGLDNDCDGQTDEGVTTTFYADADADGYGDASASTQACSLPAGYSANYADCDDTNGAINPAALEVCDGADNDCNGQLDEGTTYPFYADTDGDGFGDAAAVVQACDVPPGFVTDSSDCDDASAAVYPGAAEACNSVDDDCDGQTDEGVTTSFYADADADGFGNAALSTQACSLPAGYSANAADCDDASGSVHPGAAELCDGIDDNCDGQIDENNPGGGFACTTGLLGACAAGTTACTGGAIACDQNVQASAEICDGIDNDCDGQTDEGVTSTFYVDADGDGFGNAALSVQACSAPAGYAGNGVDCNDGNAIVHPGAAEICDGLDDDCNGQTDEGNPGGNIACVTGLLGACKAGTTACTNGAIACHQNVQASAEICDGIDNDCDGQLDENNPGGGVACGTGKQGVCAAGTTVCSGGGIHCPQNVQPSAETCDGLDNDCDGAVDDGNPGGGFACGTGLQGVCAAGTTACTAGAIACDQNVAASAEICDGLDNDCDGAADEGNPGGGIVCNTGLYGACLPGLSACANGVLDCNQAIFPQAETCNGIDDNCDGTIDEGLQVTSFLDADGDGYGTPNASVKACTIPPGYVLSFGDCDDTDPNIKPGVPELCNGIDDNCDGVLDNGSAIPFYADADGDGFGDPLVPALACAPPPGYVANGGDCNDGDPAVNPNAAETCNSVDDNCNGAVDEGVKTTFYADSDGDGFGNPSASVAACAMPPGTVANSGDCNDGNAIVHPGAIELCNGGDDDCNGLFDENNPGGGAACSTGKLGVCAPGTTVCAGGALACAQSVQPSAEACDGLDNNCNGQIDEGVLGVYYADTDGDGYGNPGAPSSGCSQPAGTVANAGDCNDGSAAVHPGAAESCNGSDDDCDGFTDEGNPGGGVACGTGKQGVCATGTTACSGGAVVCAQNVQAGPEACDGLDNNCNGQIDEGIGAGVCNTGKPGVCAAGTSACVNGASVCTQTTAASAEVCNGLDDDCDGATDEGVTISYYQDADNDGYGNKNVSLQACAQPPGYSQNLLDCNDTNANVRPGAVEICNGQDDNCNGQVDEGSPKTGVDCDNNGIADACQADNDGDHIPLSCDNCPTTNNPSQNDTDGDGKGDACDRTCITIQRGLFGNVDDTQVADDHLDPTKANQNFGASNVFNSGAVNGGPRMALLRFDLSPVPPTAILSASTLKLFVHNNTGAATVRTHVVTAAWSELGLTWNTFNAAYNPAILNSFLNGGAGYSGAVSVDVTSLSQQWLNGAIANHGLLLEQAGVLYTNYWSSEYLQNLRPALTLCYVVPG